jgi:hypothetical protein
VEAVDAPQTVTESTVSGQGEVRTAATGTTGTDGVAAKDRDGATQANKGGNGEARSKPHAAPEEKGGKDNAPRKDTAPQKDSATNEKP